MDQKLTSKEVELYLLENTEFFLSRESLVGELSFKHDIGEASSLLEMQEKFLLNNIFDDLSVLLSDLLFLKK